MDLQRASAIVARARDLADLPNAAYVSHRSEIHSLNDAWKDIYAALKDSDDDYYVSETTLTLSSAYAVAGSTNEYLVPLPSDFTQIRYLSYRGSSSGDWWPVKKFPLSMKDYDPSEPHYRIKGAYLWIIGGNVASASGSLRLGYYPPPATITLPQAPYYYGSSYTQAQLRGLSSPAWAALNRTMVYGYTGNILTAESQTLNNISSPVALFTESDVPSGIQYYKGTLFWIRAGNIYSKDTELAAAFTSPTTIVSTGTVVAFHVIDDLIYYATATEIYYCGLDGSSDTLISATAVTSLCRLGSVIYYVDSGGALKSLSPAATIVASGISKVTCDDTYLYALTTAYVLNRLTVDSTPALTATDQVASDVGALGHAVYDNTTEATAVGELASEAPSVWVLPVITREQQRLQAIDVTLDYNFSYPNNLVPEIMAYQCAIDFAEEGKDTSDLKERLGMLWERFGSSIKRDEYTAMRIRNAYDHHSWGLR